jgi:ubiquinone/menaquinone biosynthesis C-methylase UbiE
MPNRSAVKILKRRIKTWIKDALYLPRDLVDRLTRKRDPLTPPRRLIFVGDGDFRKIGNEFFTYFIEFGGLKPNHNVLDVGCGIGRMAIPLTTYLTTGTYEGFDIIDRGIRWCTRTLSAEHANFHFQLADVYNEWYNPGGRHDPADYRFPFPHESFDFVFLTSVFTHMLPREVENYFAEIVRVLRRGGRSFITYFLINNESRELITSHHSRFDFRDYGGGYWTISRTKPESAVGYDEVVVRQLHHSQGMKIVEPIRYGSWCGRKEFVSLQDIVVAEKA